MSIENTLTEEERAEIREARINARLHPRRGWGFYRFGGLMGVEDSLIAHPHGLPPGWKESNLTKEEQRELSEKVEDLVLRTNQVHWFTLKGEFKKSLPIV